MVDGDLMGNQPHPTRRRFMVAAGIFIGSVGVVQLVPIPACATPEEMAAAIRELVGEAPVREGKVKIDAPPLVENGNSVSITVSVDSPMTAEDHVKGIHIFNEKNPQPYVADFHLGPRSGRASVSTRIRLADTQRIVAIAQLNDGSFWSASADLIVTIAACVETN
jgi:sulfur-oxidizing protein SoxY